VIAKGIYSRSARSARPIYPRFSKRRGGLGPTQILALSPAVWNRWNVGVAVTGAGVSQWDDSSGNGRHLLQGTDAARPAKNADGSVLFNGTTHFLKTNAFGYNQPNTIYLLFRQISWTLNDYVWDGNILNSMRVLQNAVTPNLAYDTGGAGLIQMANGPTIGSYGVLAVVYNGATSSGQVNQNAAATGNAGATNGGGFALGVRGDNAAGFSNIEVKEVILFAAAHSADVRRKVIAYLMRLGGL
jgi:hypothetical protein